ncbi:twin-arginine translocase subunit TatC [soil metagenome]
MPERKQLPPDPDDIFADSRMSFGDHIEELRSRLFKAIKGLLFCLFIGFLLDGIGYWMHWPNFGVGRPMMSLITKPVEDMVRDYYYKRTVEKSDILKNLKRTSIEDITRIEKILSDNEGHIASLSESDREKLLGKPEMMPVFVPRESIEKVTGPLKEGTPPEIELEMRVYPGYMSYLATKGESLLQIRNFIKSQSVQEPFLIYMKVSLICGIILGSPYIFYQIWAFVAAGLFPHEKRYVHVYMPFSLGLFLFGIILCQFLVMPNAVQSLLGLNNYLGVDPDIRLDEWLSFALLLPLVFGVSFQTPLVMLFLNRIGLCTYQDYLTYWRAAAMILAVGAVIILPTPDLLTMMYLYIPMFALYLLGIFLCWYFPADTMSEDDEASQVAV